MDRRKELAESYETTTWLIGKFAEGMTHEESVVQPPFRANTFNWVLGHILIARDRALPLLGQKRVLDEAETNLYETGSEPVTAETALRLARLLEALDQSQTRLTVGLESVDAGALEVIHSEDKGQTVGDRIAGLHWHETYHVGQLEILRQVSGEKPSFP